MYTDRKTAPLAYHKFVKYFSLPVSILACVAMFVAGIIYESWLGLMFSVPMLVLHTAAFIGFLKWRYYGVMCFLAGSLLALIFELVAVTEESGNALPVLISGFIYLATMVVYYSKREPLFDKHAPKVLEEGSPADVATDIELAADPEGLTDQQDNLTRDTGDAPHSRFHEIVIRFWKYGAVAAASLVIGIMLGFLVFQGRIAHSPQSGQ